MPIRIGPLSLRTPADDALELAVVGGGGTACMALFLTVGSAEFFEQHLAQNFEDLEDERLKAMLPEIYENLMGFVCLFVLPETLSRLALGRDGRDYGLKAGRVPDAAAVAAVGSALAWLAASGSGDIPELAAYYPKVEAISESAEAMALWQASRVFYYIGWEHFFRGFLLHGLSRPLGFVGANLFQTMASVLMHIGCPPQELWGSLPYGLLAGGLSRQTGATWPLMVLHFVLGLSNDLSTSAARRQEKAETPENTVPLFGPRRKKQAAK